MESMKKQSNFFLILTLLYALFIFSLSSISSIGDQRQIFDLLNSPQIRNIILTLQRHDLEFLLYPLFLFNAYPDKAVHMILYAGFGLSLYLTMRNSTIQTFESHPYLFAILFGILYGASDEFHQSFVPGRTASLADFFADISGLIIMHIIIFLKGIFTHKT